MFNLFSKDPAKALEKKHQRLLKEAMELQRKGDIPAFAAKTAEAEATFDELSKLRKEAELNT